jgi:hypothetical protein
MGFQLETSEVILIIGFSIVSVLLLLIGIKVGEVQENLNSIRSLVVSILNKED